MELLHRGTSGRFTFKYLLEAAQKIWHKQPSLAVLIANEVLQIIHQSCDVHPSFLGGKSGGGIISGLFYISGFRHKCFKSQREIAQVLNVTDTTVRKSYHKWLENFPDLFPDLIKRLDNDVEKNTELKFYEKLRECIHYILECVIGKSGTELILLNMEPEEYAENAEELHSNLHAIFNENAFAIERAIINELFRRLDLPFPTDKEMSFKGFVEKARAMFIMYNHAV